MQRLWTFAAAATAGFAAWAAVPSPAQAVDTVPCEEFEFPSRKPSPSLHDGSFEELFFTDCLVYVSRDDRHAVVIPEGFAGVPPETYKPAVEAVLEAAGESLSVYRDISSDYPARSLFFLTERARPRAEAYVVVEPDPENFGSVCWTVIPIGTWRSISSGELPRLKHTIAHEMGHCLVDSRSDVPSHEYYARDRWWSEGSAEYFASVVYPVEDFEHRHARNYRAIQPLQTQSYPTVLFWQHYANIRGGPRAALDFAVEAALWDRADDRARLAAVPGFADVFQDFAEQALGEDGVRDEDGGRLPRPVLDDYATAIVDGAAGEHTEELSFAPFSMRYVILTLRPGFDYEIHPPTSSDGAISASVGRASAVGGAIGLARLEAPTRLEGDCDREMLYAVILTGSADLDTIEAAFRVTPVERPEGLACTDCPPGERDVDACLFGEWTVTQAGWQDVIDQTRRQLEAGGPLPPHSIALEKTENVLAICRPDEYEGYNDMTVSFIGAPRADEDLTVTGVIDRLANSSGNICVDSGAGTLRFVSTSANAVDRGSRIAMTADEFSYEMPLELTSLTPFGGGAQEPVSYVCEDDRLTLTAEAETTTPTAGPGTTRNFGLTFRLERTTREAGSGRWRRQGICLVGD